jgi:hypothetical protein
MDHEETIMPINPTQLTEMVNTIINKALAGGLNANQIAVALNNGATALGAVNPAPTHDRTITDPGSALNPNQPD